MDAAVAALIGAALGVIGTLGTTWLQQSQQTRRDLLAVAANLGRSDFERALAMAQTSGRSAIPPLSTFVAYHYDVLAALADDKLDGAKIKHIDDRHRDIAEAIYGRDLRDR